MIPKAENLPRWDGRRGWYEVWYATCTHAASGTGLWLRYTLRVPPDPGTPGDAEVWAFAFHPHDGPVFAAKQTHPLASARLASGTTIFESGEAELGEGRLAGAVTAGDGRRMRWDIAYRPASTADGPLPRVLERIAPSHYTSPNLDVRANGTVHIDGQTLELDDERFGQSHIWGRHHAGAWSWAHLAVDDGFVIEALQARPHVPAGLGRGLPTVPFVLVVLDGRPHRYAAVGRRRAGGRAHFPGWTLQLQGPDTRIDVDISAPPRRYVQVTYHDPDGTDVWCANTEVADATVELTRRAAGAWRTEGTYRLEQRAHVEFGAREPVRGVPVVF